MPEISMKHSRELREESPATNQLQSSQKKYGGRTGFPSDIVSDRDTRLTSQFWQEPTNQLGIKLSTSTAFHPQADGQQDDLAELLLLAEHAYNTAVSETTKTSPFFANYGYQPETQWIRPAASEANFTNANELLLAHWRG
jgi:hypothetical protein